ncbi:MAG: hypothetical protein PHX09_01760 [Clostridia bacterium]|nr:hypothetical protein [Clostridia bacterium]MDD4685973.1 hypothetical protein [Clostridia bacterium]
MELIETKVMSKELILSEENNDVQAIILLYKNPNFTGILKPYELQVCGKKMWEWVELACSGYSIKTIACTPETDILSLIKPLLTNKKYTLVLYSDIPLITNYTIEEIISYVRARDINVLNLSRGYVFNTEYIKAAEDIKSTLIKEFSPEEFIVADDLKQLESIGQILKGNIIDYHLQNGVVIKDIASTHIEAEVIIESGVIIEPNNILRGTSYIGKKCYLESGNTIIDSVIRENCVLKNTYIFSSKIDKNIVVGPFEKVINKG